MAALNLVLALAPALMMGHVEADPVARWQAEIAAASARFGIPDAWIRAVMRVESGGKTERGGRPIRSPKGAMGLMQLMPATWRDLRSQYGLGDDPDLPSDNIIAGTAYLRWLYDQFGYPGLFAAYNAGPSRYLAWRDRGVALPGETVAYLRAVVSRLGAPAPALLAPPPVTAPAPVREAPWRRMFVPLAVPHPDEGPSQ